jgi:L-asparaginase
VVLTSRCGAGATGLGYAGPGGDFELAEAGAIFAGYRRPLQARLELLCALSSGMDMTKIRHAFEDFPGW